MNLMNWIMNISKNKIKDILEKYLANRNYIQKCKILERIYFKKNRKIFSNYNNFKYSVTIKIQIKN